MNSMILSPMLVLVSSFLIDVYAQTLQDCSCNVLVLNISHQ